MHALFNIPIRRGLTLLSMLTSGAALLLACIAFVTYEQVVFRSSMVGDLSTTAAMVADNSASALAFSDPAAAAQTLKSVSADSHIIGAAVYDAHGKVFATYQRAGAPDGFVLPAVEPEGHRFEADSLKLFRRVELAGERSGTVYLQSDLTEMRERLWRYAVIVALVLTAAFAVVLLLSRALQVAIAGPISHLAGIVNLVATRKDYSVRAAKSGENEIGQLIDGFNDMLAQIQSRDRALQAAHDGLEQRVAERTRELQVEIVERRTAEEALRVQEERTRLVIDKAFDAIISADIEGSIIEWNAQAEKTFGWSREEALRRDLASTIIPTRYRQAHRAGLARFITHGEGPVLNKRIEITGLHRDGHEVPIELAITPIRVGAGYVFNAFVRDITERKRGEAELQSAHQQLVDLSRQAGMAEVATGVLHNVGNVLNSVNVSASLVAEIAQKSRTSSLGRVAALMREHESDLGDFLTRDPKGRQVPQYLSTLAEHLTAEQAIVIKELNSLCSNIEHIKDIVTMQQSYATVSGIKEVVGAVDLVEDSLRLNAGALSRHGVEVVREFDGKPLINADKHKILQILVNLVRNAKYACDESGRADKKMTLRVACAGERVRISVIDNGVGIAAQNLTRIFNHGFTTRANGHGFGLHSGALAARELGGSLSAHSDGLGRGATFTVELPLHAASLAGAGEVAHA